MIYIRVHASDNGPIVAMCDSGLVGKVLHSGETTLDLKIYSTFYVGRLVDKAEALEILKSTAKIYSANIVGEEAVGIALDAGIIDKGNVLHIGDVPYAHAYRIIS